MSTQSTRPAFLIEEDQRAMIREEMREIHEGEKRKDSIIIKSSDATSIMGIDEKLTDVSWSLLGTETVMDKVV